MYYQTQLGIVSVPPDRIDALMILVRSVIPKGPHLGEGISLPLRSPERSSGLSSARQASPETTSILPSLSLDSPYGSLRKSSSNLSPFTSPPQMVVKQGQTFSRGSENTSGPKSDSTDRRFLRRLGSPSRTPRAPNAGPLVSVREETAHKQPGP